jgi:O-antigen/teichoic acid export membrane protein
MFTLNVIAARQLDRTGFAQVSFALVLGQIGMVLASAGLDVSASRAIGHERRRATAFATTAIAISLPIALIVGALTVVLAPLLGSVFAVDPAVLILSGILGSILGVRLVTERTCAALGLLRAQLFIKLVEGMCIVVLAGVMLLALDSGWRGGVFAVGFAALTAVAIYLVVMRSTLRSRTIDRATARDLVPYARYAFAWSLLIVGLSYGDKVVMMRGAGPEEFAVYAAYYAGTIMVAGQAIIVLQNVLIPRAADPKLRRALLSELDRRAWVIPPALALIGAAVLGTVLTLFGPNYPIQAGRFALFVAWWVVFCRNAVMSTIVIASSRRAYRSQLRFTFMRVAATIFAFTALLVGGWVGFVSVASTMLAIELAETINLRRLRKRYLEADSSVGDGAVADQPSELSDRSMTGDPHGG